MHSIQHRTEISHEHKENVALSLLKTLIIWVFVMYWLDGVVVAAQCTATSKIYFAFPTIISQLVLFLWQTVKIDPLGHWRVVDAL